VKFLAISTLKLLGNFIWDFNKPKALARQNILECFKQKARNG
jgi:hypothetical protein